MDNEQKEFFKEFLETLSFKEILEIEEIIKEYKNNLFVKPVLEPEKEVSDEEIEKLIRGKEK